MAKSWSTYLGEVFGFAGGEIALGPLNLDWGAVVIVAIVTTLLALGTKLSSNVSAVITLIKVAVVLVVIVVGAFYIKMANYTPFIPPAEPGGGGPGEQSLFSLLTGAGSSNYGWYGLLAGASIVFFAFIGFDVVATTAEETKDPQRDVPRGILGTLAIVTVLYVAVAAVLSGMVQVHRAREGGRGRQPGDGVRPQRRRLGGHAHLRRRAGRADDRRHGLDPRPDPGAVRHVARPAVAATSWPRPVSTAPRCG